MSEYKEPIRISSNDPICSANGLEGTIIGILFEKTGKQIQEAIDGRTGTIDKKIVELQESIKDADAFVEAKVKEMEDLDDLYSERSDAKKEHLEPLRRQSRDIWNQIRNEEHGFDKETEKIIAGKAVTFEDGFEQAEKNLATVDGLIEKEVKSGFLRSGIGETGLQGAGGLMGHRGSIPGVYTYTSDGDSSNFITTNSTGDVGIGTDTAQAQLHITQQEDKALARLNTLKQKVREYVRKIEQIRGWIHNLEEEKRRLILIRNNLNPTRDYKLDLNKLSAFGFEDIEIQA